MKDLAREKWHLRITVAGLILLAIAGTGLILYITAIGPWAYSDSAAYLVTAKNIHAGRGIVLQDQTGNYSLMPLHAPLFPLAVSIPMALGAGVVQSSRWINAILFGLTILIIGGSTYRFTRSFWLSTGAGVLFLASFEPIKAFSGAMSEGLFIFLAFASLYCLVEGIICNRKSDLWILAAGILTGLTILARYLGLALIPAGFLAILLAGQDSFKVRFRKILLFIIPAIVISAVWFIPVSIASGSFGGRVIGALTNLAAKAKNYFVSMSTVYTSWLPFFNRGNHILPPVLKQILSVLIIVATTAATIVILKKRKQILNQNHKITWVMTLVAFSICYILLHLGTYLIAKTQPDVDGRLLLPLYITLVLLAAILISFYGQLFKYPWIPNLVFIIFVLLTVWYFKGKNRTYIYDMHHYGMGYTSKRWNEDPVFSQINKLNPTLRLYSNDSALVLFYTGRFPWQLEKNEDKTRYILDIQPGSGLILFPFQGHYDIGDTFDTMVSTFAEQYQVFFEDNEGLILLPN